MAETKGGGENRWERGRWEREIVGEVRGGDFADVIIHLESPAGRGPLLTLTQIEFSAHACVCVCQVSRGVETYR